jgi:hypothetical protein
MRMTTPFDPFSHLPEQARQTAARHVRLMRQAGVELVAVDTQARDGTTHYVMTYSDGSQSFLSFASPSDRPTP